MTSMASVIAIRHIDATFAELQRLQSVGDLAEEIDRRMNELRLAARDFVTDPAAQSDRVWEAASALSALLKKTRLELAPEQQDMIDGVTAAAVRTIASGIERVTALIARRAELIAALPPLREKFETAIAEVPDRATPRALFQSAKPDRRGVAGARSGRPPSSRRRACARWRSTIPRCASAVDAYADAIISLSTTRTPDRRPRQGGAGHRRPADRAGHRIVARAQRAARPRAVATISRGRWPRTNGRASCSAPPAC